jgi:hypothetical protein
MRMRSTTCCSCRSRFDIDRHLQPDLLDGTLHRRKKVSYLFQAGRVPVEQVILLVASHFEQGVRYIVGDLKMVQVPADRSQVLVGQDPEDDGQGKVQAEPEEQFIADLHVRPLYRKVGEKKRARAWIWPASQQACKLVEEPRSANVPKNDLFLFSAPRFTGRAGMPGCSVVILYLTLLPYALSLASLARAGMICDCP